MPTDVTTRSAQHRHSTALRRWLIMVMATALTGVMPSAMAAEGAPTGVWWRSQPDGAPFPAPPHVPPDGLWVASDPSGPVAMSALVLAVGPGETLRSLTLRVHGQTTAADEDLPILACPTTGNWEPPSAGPGAWDSRPEFDCSTVSARGAVMSDDDTTTVTFDLAAFAAAPKVGIAFVPREQPSAVPVPPPLPSEAWPTFDVTFEPLAVEDVALRAAPPTAQPTPTPDPAGPTAPPPQDHNAPSKPPPPPVVQAPAAPALPAPGPAPTPASVPEPVVAPADPPRTAASPPQLLTSTNDQPAARRLALFAAILLMAWAVSLYWPRSRETPSDGAPALVSPLVSRRVRLSTAPRVGRPPPLR